MKYNTIMPKQTKYDTKCSNHKTKYNSKLYYVKEKSAHLNQNKTQQKYTKARQAIYNIHIYTLNNT